MKSARLLLVSLLAFLAFVACGHDDKSSPPAGTAASAPPTSSAVPRAPVADAAPIDHILYSQALLLQNYVAATGASALLSAAWQGAYDRVAKDVHDLPPGLQPQWTKEDQANADALRQALTTLQDIAAGRVADDEITLAALDAMADSLNDDHTYFLKPTAWQRYQNGQTLGFGYSTLRQADGLLVWYIIPGGPADRAGLHAGDVVRFVNGDTTVPTMDERSTPLVPGTEASLEIERPGVGIFTIKATPEIYTRPIVNSSILDGKVAYLRLFRFPSAQQMPPGQTFAPYLDEIMADLRRQGARAWILDLRNNPGGSEAAAAVMAGRFGLEGNLIENRGRGGAITTLRANGESGLAGAPLVILTNEGSSSSSELVAASLQDAKQAFVMGVRSSGIVNTSRSWEVDGGGLFVTTQRAYAGPEKRYLNAEGVYPDEVVTLSRFELARGHDTQIEAALGYLRTKLVAESGVR